MQSSFLPLRKLVTLMLRNWVRDHNSLVPLMTGACHLVMPMNTARFSLQHIVRSLVEAGRIDDENMPLDN